MKKTSLALLALIIPFTASASITTYNLDKEAVCKRIFSSPNFSNFIALREFFRLYPRFVETFNPADPRYCLNLKIAYSFFSQNEYSPQEVSEFYNNCMNLSDQEVAFENESFLRIQSAIVNCHL